MQDLNDLYYYVQIVDHGGFAPAGRALGIPKSKLSRRIALLEERLGVRLIHRTSRRFTVTELGHAYYTHCKAMLVEAEAAQTVIESAHTEPCGTIHLSCPIALLHACVGAMLVDFAIKYPQVNIQLNAINRPVDVLAEGIDIALRVRPLPLEDSDLAFRVLAHASQCLVASPKLVKQFGAPTVPADLSAWPSLSYGSSQKPVWKLQGEKGAKAELHHVPRFVATDMMILRDAAVANIGVVQLPTMLVHDQLVDGTLVRLLPTWNPRHEAIHAVFPSRRGLVSSVRALIDHLVTAFENVTIN